MLRAMLVAAGFGTRLAPLTDELPKPAVPVVNRPLAWFALEHLRRAGVREFVVNTHHLGERLEASLAPWTPDDVSVRFSREATILGTGGGLREAWRPWADEPLLVVNAKLVFDPDVTQLLREHAERGAIATMVLRAMPTGEQFGGIDVDAGGRVRGILEDSPPAPGQVRRMFTGVHVLHPRAWRDLPRQGCVIRTSYKAWLARGEEIHSVMSDRPWADFGITPTHYGEGNLQLLSGERRWPGIEPDSRGVIDDSASVGEGCVLRRCAVGPRARIDGGVRLQDCVVWPGAHVTGATGDLSRAIVTTAGVVVPF